MLKPGIRRSATSHAIGWTDLIQAKAHKVFASQPAPDSTGGYNLEAEVIMNGGKRVFLHNQNHIFIDEGVSIMTDNGSPAYIRVQELMDAWKIMQERGGRTRTAWVSPYPGDLDEAEGLTWIDLSDLKLDEIEETPDGWRIGASTTLTQLRESKPFQSVGGGLLSKAARKTAHFGLRNLATLGAVLEQPESAPELSAALLALDVEMVTFAGEESSGKLEDSWGNGQLEGIPVRIEIRGGRASGSIEWVGRSPMDRAIVVMASSLQLAGGRIAGASLAVAGDGIRPQRLQDVEEKLTGERLDSLTRGEIEEAIGGSFKPGASYRAGPEYQLHLAKVLGWRVLTSVMGEVEQS